MISGKLTLRRAAKRKIEKNIEEQCQVPCGTWVVKPRRMEDVRNVYEAVLGNIEKTGLLRRLKNSEQPSVKMDNMKMKDQIVNSIHQTKNGIP